MVGSCQLVPPNCSSKKQGRKFTYNFTAWPKIGLQQWNRRKERRKYIGRARDSSLSRTEAQRLLYECSRYQNPPALPKNTFGKSADQGGTRYIYRCYFRRNKFQSFDFFSIFFFGLKKTVVEAIVGWMGKTGRLQKFGSKSPKLRKLNIYVAIQIIR